MALSKTNKQQQKNKQQTRKQMSERMWKNEALCIVGGNINWCSHCGKQHAGSSKN